MQEPAKRQRCRTVLRRVLVAGFLLPSALCLLAGCAGMGQQTVPVSDPLLGGPPLKASAPGAPKNSGQLTALPAPIPENNTGQSTAALASITPLRGADNNRDLRIAGNTSDPWARQTGPVPRSDGSGAVLRGPEPAIEPVARREETTASPVAQPNGRITTYEQAQAQLAARGISWQRLEKTEEKGEWQFSCSVPNRQNPRLRRTYQARNADYLGAMRAVLEQIDKDQQG